MPMELSEMSLEEVLRSYSSIKGHRTRCEKEIANLLGLLNTQYSSTSEDCINDPLEKLERRTLWLSDITDYLLSLKYNKAKGHEEEVAEFMEVLDHCSTDVFAVLHNRHAAAEAVAAPAQLAAPVRPTPHNSHLQLNWNQINSHMMPLWLITEPGWNSSGHTSTLATSILCHAPNSKHI